MESELSEMSTRNVAVIVDQPSVVICQSNSIDNISQLHFTPLEYKKELPIWSSQFGVDSKNFIDPFTVIKDHVSVKLYINSTSLDSAGTFTWKGTFATEGAFRVSKSIAQLIVLGMS